MRALKVFRSTPRFGDANTRGNFKPTEEKLIVSFGLPLKSVEDYRLMGFVIVK
jgi:hypothetical protein